MEWWDCLYLNEGLLVNLMDPCPYDADPIMYRLCDNGRKRSPYTVNPLLRNTVSEVGEVIVLGKLSLYTLKCTYPDKIYRTDKWVTTLRKPTDTLFFVVEFSLSGRCTPSLSLIVSMRRLLSTRNYRRTPSMSTVRMRTASIKYDRESFTRSFSHNSSISIDFRCAIVL
jgi:hypothetical protein